ncbi:MAG: amidohydrolase family protein [Clostridia bacterium]|nr:amidohydrolase family protein [Clostridia bacterium]
MDYEVIDFHTHPFWEPSQNICHHKEACNMSAGNTRVLMENLGITKICGSVLRPGQKNVPVKWNMIRQLNDDALRLQKIYGDFYVPGFHVHPHFVKESCEEIERMAGLGIKLIGELCPYMHGNWSYDESGFDTILECAEAHGMVISFHGMFEDAMDNMVKRHPNTVLISAHPGEYKEFMRNMKRMAWSKNFYMDVSGYGIFRYGMLRYAIDRYGAERFIFGSDYPTCNPAMYLGGVMMDPLLAEDEKKAILSGNIKRILNI